MKVSSVSVLTIIAFILGIIGIAVPLAIFITSIQYKTDNSYYGNIGDWFGGIAGPLLSFSSFIIVYVALRLQSKESNEQKAESLIQQNLASVKRFEESFFYLFAQFNSTIEKLWTLYVRVEKKSQEGPIHPNDLITSFESEGRSFFSNILKQIDDIFHEHFNDSNKESKNEVIKKSYLRTYLTEEESLNLYFKQIQLLLSYINNSNLISEDEKPFYISIIDNNFTNIEKIILNYHVLYYELDDFNGLKHLVEKYHLTTNLNANLLISNSHRFIPKGWITKDSILKNQS